jgi:hypothetical protein
MSRHVEVDFTLEAPSNELIFPDLSKVATRFKLKEDCARNLFLHSCADREEAVALILYRYGRVSEISTLTKIFFYIGCATARDAEILKIMMTAPSEAWHLVADEP